MLTLVSCNARETQTHTLGLWGKGTPFSSKHDFVNLLKKGGVAAMELVAMELKHAGCYIARTLSYEVSSVHHKL